MRYRAKREDTERKKGEKDRKRERDTGYCSTQRDAFRERENTRERNKFNMKRR